MALWLKQTLLSNIHIPEGSVSGRLCFYSHLVDFTLYSEFPFSTCVFFSTISRQGLQMILYMYGRTLVSFFLSVCATSRGFTRAPHPEVGLDHFFIQVTALSVVLVIQGMIQHLHCVLSRWSRLATRLPIWSDATSTSRQRGSTESRPLAPDYLFSTLQRARCDAATPLFAS